MNRKAPPPEFEDAPELTAAQIAAARPASQVHSAKVSAALVRPQGRPAKPDSERKVPVSIRLSPDVLAELKATGKGWQTLVNTILATVLRYTQDAADNDVADRGAMHLENILEWLRELDAEVGSPAPEQLTENADIALGGASLFERMANLPRDSDTGEVTARDSRSGRFVTSRLAKASDVSRKKA